jgi:hypothetical protein
VVHSIYKNAAQDTLPTNIDSITTKILFFYEKGAWMIKLQSIREKETYIKLRNTNLKLPDEQPHE